MVGDGLADLLQIFGNNALGDAAAEIHQPGDRSARRRRSGVKCQLVLDLGHGGRRQALEHRQMHGDSVVLGGIMRPAKTLNEALASLG